MRHAAQDCSTGKVITFLPGNRAASSVLLSGVLKGIPRSEPDLDITYKMSSFSPERTWEVQGQETPPVFLPQLFGPPGQVKPRIRAEWLPSSKWRLPEQ